MKDAFVLQRVTHDDLYAFIASQCEPRLREELRAKGKQRRLRVTDLPLPVMERLAQTLYAEGGDTHWAARCLVPEATEEPWQATATKLIDLRNNLDPPLLVFMPPGLRTAAEDSLDVATFTEIPIAPRTREFAADLLRQIASPLRQQIEDALRYLRRERVVRTEDAEVEYLLTVKKNGGDGRAAGGAIYLFGLLPDFELFSRLDSQQRLAHNVILSAQLADTRRPLQERIGRLRIEPNTLQGPLFLFLRDRHVDEPTSWTSLIACDLAHRALAFEHWRLLDGEGREKLRLVLDPLELPMQEADEVGGATPMRVWNLKQGKPLKVSYASSPPPAHVEAWKHVRIQLLELNDGQTSPVWTSTNAPKPKAKARTKRFSRQIKPADVESLPEGSYILRIDALGPDGTVLTEAAVRDEGGRPENESILFLVLRDGSATAGEEQPRAVKTTSFSDAWTSIAAKATDARRDNEALPSRGDLTGTWEQPAGTSVRGDAVFTFENSGANGLSILLPGLVRRLEHEALSHPELFGWFRLDLADTRDPSAIEIKRRWTAPTPPDPLTQTFLAARKALFAAILGQHARRARLDADPRRQGSVETVDLIDLRAPIESYVHAYLEWARGALRDAGDASLRRLIGTLDVTELRWRSNGGDPGRALLMGPLHPLRMLWHLQHAIVVDQTLKARQMRSEDAPSWPKLIDEIQRGLLPRNLPMVLFDESHRGFVEREALTTHWTLYLPDRCTHGQRVDVATALGTARRLLGVRGTYVRPAGLSAEEIAGRIIEYLGVHPYVEQLRLNVFNPGDGQLIADTLRAVERLRLTLGERAGDPPSLRYAVQLFAPAEHLDESGEALDALLDPERQVADTDEFTLAASNHLLPKLLVARGSLDEFLRAPELFGAHITVFAEYFRANTRLGDVRDFDRGTFVAGLVQEPETRFLSRRDGLDRGWLKGIRPKAASDAETLERLLVETHTVVQAIEAADASGEVAAEGIVPTLSLRLEPVDQSLIRLVHDTSDWVLTIDRNLGIDYFDSASGGDDTGYLLDFSPEFLQEDQARVMLTTRSTTELEQILGPTLEAHRLKLPEGGERMVLETLRSLSGRFALRLQSGPALASEVVGMLVARWALERTGLLRNPLVIPLDAHRRWFGGDDDDALAVIRRRRADLLVVRLRSDTRAVEVHVMETGYRPDQGVRDGARIHRQMHEQADLTVKRMRELFDLDLYTTPRADRLLRAKEFANVLRFYLARARRYALIEDTHARDAATFIETLDSGYRLEFHTSALTYIADTRGVHLDEEEPGFPVHRTGGDVAQRLLDAALVAFGQDVPVPEGAPPSPRDPSKDLIETFAQLRHTLAPDEAPWSPRVSLPPPPPPSADPVELPPLLDTPVEATPVVPPEPAPSAPPAVITNLPVAPSPEPQSIAVSADPSPPAVTPAPVAATSVEIGNVVMLGATERTQQFGILGRAGGTKLAVDLNGCNTISLFGVQGFGKSYTMGVIAEMAVQPMPGINMLPSPLATVIFHYHKSDSYEPEFASAVAPNTKVREIDRLLADYNASPAGLEDVVLLVPDAKLAQRREEYPGIEIRPIKFASSELGADGWKFLMGAVGNDSLYVKQLVSIMQRARGKLTLAKLKTEVEDADLPKNLRKIAETRIGLAEDYIDDSARLGEVLRPGRTVIVDLRDEWLERDDALGLFVVMMTIFGAQKHEGRVFNKLMVFDEAHKYITESDLIGQVVGIIREMRHQATSVLIASQDPLSVPRAVIELTSLLILHRMTSPQWLKHLKTAIGALEPLTEAQVGSLVQGEALVWTQRSTDLRYTQRPQKIQVRPRVTQHGGGTKTAVHGATMR